MRKFLPTKIAQSPPLRALVMVCAVLGSCLISTAALASERAPQATSDALFLIQIIFLLTCARLLGEGMQRMASRRLWVR